MKRFINDVWKTTAGKFSVVFLAIAIIMTISLIKNASSMELLAIPFAMVTGGFYIASIAGFIVSIACLIRDRNPKKHQRLSKVLTVCAWGCAALCLIAGGTTQLIFWLMALSLSTDKILKNILYYGGLIVVSWAYLFLCWIVQARYYGGNWLSFENPFRIGNLYPYHVWATILIVMTVYKLYKHYSAKKD